MSTHAEVYRDDAGEWRWRLIAANGRIIADSGQGYLLKADAMHGLRLATSPPERVDTLPDERVLP